MKTYFCEQAKRAKPGEKTIIMEGQLDCIYQLEKNEITGSWIGNGISVDGIIEKAHISDSDWNKLSENSDVLYGLKFNRIQKLIWPWKIGVGGPNHEGWTYLKVPPKYWIYAENGYSLLVSLNEWQIKDAEKDREVIIIADQKPHGEMLWNEKSRMA